MVPSEMFPWIPSKISAGIVSDIPKEVFTYIFDNTFADSQKIIYNFLLDKTSEAISGWIPGRILKKNFLRYLPNY